MLKKKNAARIAPCRQPASASAASTKIARIQMLMPPLKIIPQKMHYENCAAGCKARQSRYVCRVQISVIVPAFNEEKLLGASLAEIKTAAAAFTRLGWDFELIVCDNNSTDRTADIARAAGAKVVFEPVNQIARARNCGAAAATGDWLIFVDADSHPSAELFADVAEQIPFRPMPGRWHDHPAG